MSDPTPTTPCVTWEVFPNTDADRGGWYSYVADGVQYLGGDWHSTQEEARRHARRLARLAEIEREAGK